MPVVDWSQVRTVTAKEAAWRLKKTERTIYHWLRQGRLRGFRPGGPRCSIRISEESLHQILIGPAFPRGA